jgi:hypothetical protein
LATFWLPLGYGIFFDCRFVITIINIALALEATGALVDAARFMAKMAIEARQSGGMKFGWLNRQLQKEPDYRRNRHYESEK